MEEKIEVEVSARHIHLSEADYNKLFPNEELKNEVKLSQEDCATDKKLEIVGPKGSLFARVLSPFRQRTQAELSLTDCYQIGVTAPYEIEIASGCANITIKSEKAEIHLCALMIAKRHMHVNSSEAKKLSLSEGQQVSAEVETERGRILFDNITVKVAENYHMAIHLDTDEGNAAGIKGKTIGKLIITNG